MISNDGKASGLWVWGTTLYMGVLLTVLGKAALISKYVHSMEEFDVTDIDSVWTKYTLAAIPGSFAFSMVALPVYAIVAPLIGFSRPYEGIVSRLWGGATLYFCLILFPVACLLRDYVWK
jgi:phospholipid-transporting ATPase